MLVLNFFGIVILILLIISIILYGLPMTKGWTGERVVRIILKSLPKDKYIVLNDIKFYGKKKTNVGNGRYEGKRWSCQIDHLVISPYGIFCIETKNYLGKIIGNYQDKYLNRKVLGMNYNTYSPIYQNYRHLQRLVETFPLIKKQTKSLHSIICFMPGGKIRILGSGAACICKTWKLKKEIIKYQNPVISLQDCQAITTEVCSASKKLIPKNSLTS